MLIVVVVLHAVLWLPMNVPPIGVQSLLLFKTAIRELLPSRNTHATAVRCLSFLDGLEYGHQSYCLRLR